MDHPGAGPHRTLQMAAESGADRVPVPGGGGDEVVQALLGRTVPDMRRDVAHGLAAADRQQPPEVHLALAPLVAARQLGEDLRAQLTQHAVRHPVCERSVVNEVHLRVSPCVGEPAAFRGPPPPCAPGPVRAQVRPPHTCAIGCATGHPNGPAASGGAGEGPVPRGGSGPGRTDGARERGLRDRLDAPRCPHHLVRAATGAPVTAWAPSPGTTPPEAGAARLTCRSAGRRVSAGWWTCPSGRSRPAPDRGPRSPLGPRPGAAARAAG